MNCSECGRRVPKHRTGRPRDTCSARCLSLRAARRKREARAARNKATAENPLLVASQKEFRHWARTGEDLVPRASRRLTVEELLEICLRHSCPACRRRR